MRFLVLMSGGVVQSILEYDNFANVDVNVANLVAKELSERPLQGQLQKF